MSIGSIASRVTVIIGRETRLDEAARLMREHHVGSLVVADESPAGRVPVGIITDRDIVIEAVAAGIKPETLTAGEIMVPKIVTCRERDGIWDTIQLMRREGMRRMPVVNDDGVLLGIVTVDDLLELLGDELEGLVKVIANEQKRERALRR